MALPLDLPALLDLAVVVLIAAYVRLPWAWPLLGKQFLLVSEKPA